MTILHKFLNRHKRILALAMWVLRKTRKQVSWTDMEKMAAKWCRELPRDFDCIIGIPRAGLIVANQMAINMGLPLSTPESFMMGVYWQGKYSPVNEFRRILVVDDSVDVGRDLNASVDALRLKFPSIDFRKAALAKIGSCELDYFYCTDDNWRFCFKNSKRS